MLLGWGEEGVFSIWSSFHDMEAVAEGLWRLADYHEEKGELGKAIKCLEAICQSQVSFFPVVEVKTRLRIATLLLTHSHNVNHAKSHLERSV